MFEDDKRFKAVELEADREDLFRNYSVDLQKKVYNSFSFFFCFLRCLLMIYILVNFDTIETKFEINQSKTMCIAM